MDLRSMSVNGELVEFTIWDCPVRISDAYVALFKRENSDLLYYSYIVRGQYLSSEVGLVYEGDIMCDEYGKELGVLFYDTQWRLLDKHNGTKNIPHSTHIQMKKGNVGSLMQIREVIKYRPNIAFKYAKKFGNLGDVVGSSKEGLIVAGLKEPVDTNIRLHMNTGYYHNGRTVYFGDYIEGYGVVKLYDCKPAAISPGGRVTLLSKFCENWNGGKKNASNGGKH